MGNPITGYYICYEDTDSRVKPWYEDDDRDGVKDAPFETELHATTHLLLYFQEMKANLNRCIVNTKAQLEKM